MPRMMAPAALMRSTTMSSASGTKSWKMREPLVVRSPWVGFRSLMATGTPWRGPDARPAMRSASAVRAASMAWPSATVMYALSEAFCLSMRSRKYEVSSTGESFLERMRSARRQAGVWLRLFEDIAPPGQLAHGEGF